MSTLTKIISFLLFIAAAAAAFAFMVFIYTNKSFLDETKLNTELSISKGDSFTAIYDELYDGLTPPYAHKTYLTKILGFDKKLHYGYYAADNISLGMLLSNISEGRETLIKVAMPEGFNIFDVASQLERLGVLNKEDFLNTVFDQHYIEYLTGEKYKSLEGFLFPGTYFFPKYYEPKKVINTMYSAFKKNLPDGFENGVEKNGLSFYDAIKLASIVQKETYLEDESPIVASVFYNRIKLGMRLQADPTIIYGRYLDYDGNIRKKDIKDAMNIYNTYTHNGLPPTPISNPSKIALSAVMKPADTNYIYFVANNAGKHLFSVDYIDHVNNVNRYQRSK